MRAHDAEEIYHRQYEALVVVGVLADEINASRRVHANDGRLAEFLGEDRQRPRFNAINVGQLCRHAEIRSGLSRCTSFRRNATSSTAEAEAQINLHRPPAADSRDDTDANTNLLTWLGDRNDVVINVTFGVST